jgi:hypothetical protein
MTKNSNPTTTVTKITDEPFGGGVYEIRCSCGEVVRYRGENFTRVEAQRHAAYCARKATALPEDSAG